MKSCAVFILALAESTDISDMDQHVIFIRAVSVGFHVVEFLDIASLSSTATGQDICEHVSRVMAKFELNPAKLCSLTTFTSYKTVLPPRQVGQMN